MGKKRTGETYITQKHIDTRHNFAMVFVEKRNINLVKTPTASMVKNVSHQGFDSQGF